ncbi:MAG: hypothetical protein Q9182_000592 [Xanthomendoza sp. 2 TL-2023]
MPLHPLTTHTGSHPLHLDPTTYIHLRAHLSTTLGPLTIKAHCIVNEKAVIGSPFPPPLPSPNKGERNGDKEGEGEDAGSKGVVLENHTTIATNAILSPGVTIGEGCVIGVGARVGTGAVVGKYRRRGGDDTGVYGRVWE